MSQQLVNDLPTSNIDIFKDQLNNPNREFKNVIQKNTAIRQINKNLVIAYSSDSAGCGHIRSVFPMTYMNSVFGKSGKFNLLLSPNMIFQDDILKRARTIYFQRTMAPQLLPQVQKYKQLQEKYKYKMHFDCDDFIFLGEDDGESIPDYNFGKKTINKNVRDTCVEVMKLMDTLSFSTQFLADYVISLGIDKKKVRVLSNAVCQYFWGTEKKKPITRRIEKPTIVWSASPTHWSNELKLAGDMDNSWQEFIIKNVMDNKINFVQMGGLPWFFEPIKDKIRVMPWVYSFQYHLAVKDTKADFGISPLVPNYFNYSKSYIKYQEYCAEGMLGIGTTFTNGKPSPYDVCKVQAPDNITVGQIEELFDKYCEPEFYNDIITKQYQQLIDENWYLESAGYVNQLLEIF